MEKKFKLKGIQPQQPGNPVSDDSKLWEQISDDFRRTAHDYKDGKFDYRTIWQWFQNLNSKYSITKKA